MISSQREQIERFILKNQKHTKVIAFDVFDTLIVRNIAPPEQVMVPAAKELKKILKNEQIEISLINCLEMRIKSIEKLGIALTKKGFETECSVSEILSEWVRQYLTEENVPKTIKRLLNTELEAEKSICRARKDLLSLVQKLKRTGKRLIFISDMYLNESHIFKILNNNGYKGIFRKGYVSSDIGFSKKSGRLFKYVLEKENIRPKELLHIGDDAIADYESPKSIGINAYQYRDKKRELWSYRHRKISKLERKNSFWHGARWLLMIPPNCDEEKRRCYDDFYKLGLSNIGPLFTNFIHRIIEMVYRERSDLIIFPAREGFILKDIYDRFCETKERKNLPESRYVFLSRKSTFLPSIGTIGEREIQRGLSTEKSLQGFLDKCMLPSGLYADLALKHGFNSIESRVKLPSDITKLREFFSDKEFLREFNYEKHRQRSLLDAYLESNGFWDCERVSIVDVGWDGSIQESISNAFGNDLRLPFIDGYYMALLGRTAYPCKETDKSKFNGIYFDYRNPGNRIGIGRYTELFEIAARAPHGTTLSYSVDEKGKTIPKVENVNFHEMSVEILNAVSSVQAGILDYVDQYLEWLPFQEYPPVNYSEFILSQIDRLTRYPSKNEARQYSTLALQDEFEGGRPSRFLKNRNKESTIWPEGMYAAKKYSGMKYIFNLYRAFTKKDF